MTKDLYIQHAKHMHVYVPIDSLLIAAVSVKEKIKRQTTIIAHYEKHVSKNTLMV